MKFRLELVPRYGTTIGIVWKIFKVDPDDEDEKENEEAIGHIRISSKEEEELWTLAIKEMNQKLEKLKV